LQKQRNEADKMTAKNIVKERVADTGITLSELSRRTGIPYNRVHRTLKGNARLMANDFLVYCKALKIEIK
jgi:DNA-binding IclR family transcriptional regulator